MVGDEKHPEKQEGPAGALLEDIIGTEEEVDEGWKRGEDGRVFHMLMVGDERHPGKQEGLAEALVKDIIGKWR